MGGDVEAVEIIKDDAGEEAEELLYDEDGKVIGEMLAGDDQDDFERELDTMLESLDLTDDEDDLELMESDLAGAGAFERGRVWRLGRRRRGCRVSGIGRVAVTPMAAGLGAGALSGLSDETEEMIGQAVPAGISEETVGVDHRTRGGKSRGEGCQGNHSPGCGTGDQPGYPCAQGRAWEVYSAPGGRRHTASACRKKYSRGLLCYATPYFITSGSF